MNAKRPMPETVSARPREGERGSALILATLVTVIMSLLGVSYIMMAETENRIAENERNAAMALYVAEAGTRLAIAWFNDPTSTGYLVPTSAQVDRARRLLDHDNNSATARVLAASADATKPLYKDAAFTASPIFERPYRSAMADTFFGVETGTDPDPTFAADGPDLVVSAAHLTTINNTLFPNFPSGSLRARIARIEIYSPPVVDLNGVPTRMGVATIRVVGGVFMYPGTASERQVATRVVKAVVNEVPVPGPVGPMQSCSNMDYNGSFEVNWGTGSAIANADLPSNLNSKADTGLPYALNDPYTYINGANTVASWAASRNGMAIDDPWLKFIAGGTIDEAPNTNVQPWPHAFPGSTTDDHSNLFQNTVINCPKFDYNLWKSVSQSGGRNHYYYKYDTGGNFKLDGMGAATTFRDATNGRSGVFFFDTVNSLVPNGLPYNDPSSNLTPEIDMSGGTWGTQGFLYLNVKNFHTTGVSGVTRTVFPPGEPGDGSGFVNLDYPSSLGGSYTIRDGTVAFRSFQDPVTGDWFCTDAQQCDAAARLPAAAPVRDGTGLPFSATDIAVDGVMYISGVYTTQGNLQFYGSVVAEQGVLDGGGTPGFFFDESLIKGNWPRKGMNIPRVIVSVWQSEL